MVALDRHDLIEGLREIVARLRDRRHSAAIQIVGGAALALRYFDRDTTNDIDALIRPKDVVSRTNSLSPVHREWVTIFDADDIAQLLTICGVDSVDDAEQLYEEFFPGELPKDSTYRILETVFRVGLPHLAEPPPVPEL